MSRAALSVVPKEPAAARLQDFRDDLEQLLRAQHEHNPANDEVSLRLLELYFEQQRRDEFLRAAGAFHRRQRQATASTAWRRVSSMGRMLLPGEPMFSTRGSDVIEFIGAAQPAPAPGQPKVRRFGDALGYRALFEDLARRYEAERRDPRFLAEFELHLIGLPTRRPTPLMHARRLSQHLGGAQVYLKREDLAGDHPHLTTAVIGQALLARRLGKKVLATGTTDGRRGLAAAAVAARLGLRTVVFMDAAQAERAAANVLLMKLMGAELRIVKAEHYRNRDVREAALEHWMKHPDETFVVTGLDAAPAPYPLMTQDFTSAIGRECRRQAAGPGRSAPDLVVARGHDTADALGLFPAFLAESGTRLVCVDPAGEPEVAPREAEDPFNQTAMPLSQREKALARQIMDRLEYPAVAREHALLKATGRVEYVETSRAAALHSLTELARLEGVVPPLATAHALAFACAAARDLLPGQSVVVMMAESVDKDVWDIRRLLEGATPAPG